MHGSAQSPILFVWLVTICEIQCYLQSLVCYSFPQTVIILFFHFYFHFFIYLRDTFSMALLYNMVIIIRFSSFWQRSPKSHFVHPFQSFVFVFWFLCASDSRLSIFPKWKSKMCFLVNIWIWVLKTSFKLSTAKCLVAQAFEVISMRVNE